MSAVGRVLAHNVDLALKVCSWVVRNQRAQQPTQLFSPAAGFPYIMPIYMESNGISATPKIWYKNHRPSRADTQSYKSVGSLLTMTNYYTNMHMASQRLTATTSTAARRSSAGTQSVLRKGARQSAGEDAILARVGTVAFRP